MKNWKESISSFCGLLILLSATMATVSTQITLPSWVMTWSIIVGAVSAAVVGWLTGKNPNLTSKTPAQVEKLNKEQEITK